MDTNSTWSSLSVPYFIPVCHSVMDSYFVNQGFIEIEAQNTSLLYFRQGIFVKVGYDDETSPYYSPVVNIGFAQGGTVAIWSVIPKDREEYQYWNWRFTNQVDLEKVLCCIRDTVINAYARPLWEAPSTLKSFVDQQTEETNSRFRTEVIEQKKQRAAIAFESHNYQLAFNLYNELEKHLLSPVELKRLHLSLKRLTRH